MPKKLTNEQFIEKALAVHGNKYSYNKVVYKNSKIKVKIVCSDHGDFDQAPSGHLAGKGCPFCGGSKQISFEKFVENANILHNRLYKYDQNSFNNMREKTRIICKNHGEYWQEPYVHLRPNGCKKCAVDKVNRDTQEVRKNNFINQLSHKFRNKITYELGEYVSGRSELTFRCTKHGTFSAIANYVMHSEFGCNKCYNAKINESSGYFESDEKFTKWIETEILSDTSLREYTFSLKKRSSDQATILGSCPNDSHKTYQFVIKRNAKRYLKRCKICLISQRNTAVKNAYHKKRLEFEAKWKKSISEIYDDFYDVSLVKYETARDRIKVRCPEHGLFSTTPDQLLQGGCRLCADLKLNGLYSERYFGKHPDLKTVSAEIYYLRLKVGNIVFFKVGITRGTTKQRHAMLNTCDELSWEIISIKSCELYAAWQLEEEIQRQHGDSSRILIPLNQDEIRRIRLGPSECFGEPLGENWVKEFN